jgi:hypothetical protein
MRITYETNEDLTGVSAFWLCALLTAAILARSSSPRHRDVYPCRSSFFISPIASDGTRQCDRIGGGRCSRASSGKPELGLKPLGDIYGRRCPRWFCLFRQGTAGSVQCDGSLYFLWETPMRIGIQPWGAIAQGLGALPPTCAGFPTRPRGPARNYPVFC